MGRYGNEVPTAQGATLVPVNKHSRLMLYRKIMTLCYLKHTKAHKYPVWAEHSNAWYGWLPLQELKTPIDVIVSSYNLFLYKA